MRKLREVLRLRYELKLGYQQIGRSCAIGVGTVHKYLKRAEAAGVTWPLPEDWDEARVDAVVVIDPPLHLIDRTGEPLVEGKDLPVGDHRAFAREQVVAERRRERIEIAVLGLRVAGSEAVCAQRAHLAVRLWRSMLWRLQDW